MWRGRYTGIHCTVPSTFLKTGEKNKTEEEKLSEGFRYCSPDPSIKNSIRSEWRSSLRFISSLVEIYFSLTLTKTMPTKKETRKYGFEVFVTILSLTVILYFKPDVKLATSTIPGRNVYIWFHVLIVPPCFT